MNMKTITTLLILSATLCSIQSSNANNDQSLENPPSISIDFGDEVIEPKGIRKADQIDSILEEYALKKYKDYRVIGTLCTVDKRKRFIKTLFLENSDEDSQCIIFDMTAVYKRLAKSSDKKTRTKIKELIEWHKPDKPSQE